jgi:hypothetical protein
MMSMGAKHVVALHEGFHGELPIGRENRSVPPLRFEIGYVVSVKAIGERADRIAVAGRVVIEVDEHAPAPDFRPDLRKFEIVGIELPLAEHVLAVTKVFSPSRFQRQPWNGQMKPCERQLP